MRCRFLNRLALTVSLEALTLTASASPAAASVTIGQTDPEIPPPMSNCAGVAPRQWLSRP